MMVLCCSIHLVALAQEPDRYELVIHEIFADPTPARQLPSSEFIEIRNTSTREINLKNLGLSNGSSIGRTTVSIILKPDSLILLCPASSLAQFNVYGPAISVSPWPALNNEGDTLLLLSPSGNIIHAIVWNQEWYNNPLKEEGGWSLEMKDSRYPCEGKENWDASIDPKGGTPSLPNSVHSTISDSSFPRLLYSYMPDSITLISVFSEPIGNVDQIGSGSADLSITTIFSNAPIFNSLTIKLNKQILPGKIYTLDGIVVSDCSHNKSPPQQLIFGRFSDVKPSDLVINEILFNPFAGGDDYVEIFNRSGKIIDFSTLFLANRNSTGRIASLQKICVQPYPSMPGSFLVATEHSAALKHQYHSDLINCIEVHSMPSFPDDHGTVVIIDDKGRIIDELSYDEKWHFPLIGIREGVALERIRADAETQDASNWHSASSSSGYGTPGKMNSQSFTTGSAAAAVTISSPIISPDLDGRDDYILIQYAFSVPGYVANITVFDSNGQLVKQLVRNALCGLKGQFRWDGDGNDQQQLRQGPYIILTDVFNTNGNTKRYKHAVGLVKR